MWVYKKKEKEKRNKKIFYNLKERKKRNVLKLLKPFEGMLGW